MSHLEARIVTALDALDCDSCNALSSDDNPFISHEFLSALERSASLREEWGWSPAHLTLWDGEALVGAMPGYRKTNSHGEFVFDHAWAHAYAQHGLDYFPKWLFGVPYSPVTGPRLLVREPGMASTLLSVAKQMVGELGWSSAHVNFHTREGDAHFDENWLLREDVQYHWKNEAGWQTFDDFLRAMDHKHRKNIRQERRKVHEAGVTFRWLDGQTASEADLDAMHGFYLQTFAEYGNSPALTREFIGEIARTMPDKLLIILAYHAGETIAGALCLRSSDTLYGRYWGATRTLPGLHFETCYYQGIEYCLRHGLTRFEPGAQGEHKLARGFLPSIVRSRHWIADPRFRAALKDWCAEEVASVRRYAASLAAHSPFKATA